MTATAVQQYRGGRVATTPDDGAEKPKVVRKYPCFANGCPMPGTIFAGAVQGGTGEDRGACAWHYGVKSNDIPRVTSVLQQWAPLSYEVNEARRVLTNTELRSDPAAVKAAFEAAWERLSPQVGNWAEVLQPSTIKHRDPTTKARTVDTGMPESYADWARRMEAFVGLQVVERRAA